MSLRLFGLIFVLLTTQCFAQGRSPAVEDFVGVDFEHLEHTTPQGAEAFFNLEKDIQKINSSSSSAQEERPTRDASAFFAMLFILSLPLVSWLLVIQHLKKRASIESASNIEMLEVYRKRREHAKSKEKKDAA